MLDENFIVEKSNELVMSEMAKFDLTMLRLLEIYLSKINARDPYTMNVEFTKQEFCSLLRIHPKSNIKQIKNACRNLRKMDIEFAYKTKTARGIRGAVLFNTCDIENQNGQIIIRMHANPDVQWLFFNLQNSGYTSYALKYTLGLSTKYSYLLHQYLRMQYSVRHRNEAEKCLTVQEVRTILGIEDKYADFRDVSRIIKDAVADINEKTDLQTCFSVLKEGKKAIGFHFIIKKDKHKLLEAEEQPPQAEENLDEPDDAFATELDEQIAGSPLIFEL